MRKKEQERIKEKAFLDKQKRESKLSSYEKNKEYLKTLKFNGIDLLDCKGVVIQ